MKKYQTNYTFRSLEELNRTITILPKAQEWPSSNIENQLDLSLEGINNLSKNMSSFEVSKARLAKLQVLLDAFVNDKWHNINTIIASNPKNLSKILYNCSKLRINEKFLSHEDNLSYLLLIIKKTPKNMYTQIIVPLMKIYLSKKMHIEELKQIIQTNLDKIPESSSDYILDFNLYSNKEYLLKKLLSQKSDYYRDDLISMGVDEKYIYTDYFNDLFFEWILQVKKYDYEFLSHNRKLFATISADQCKVIFAYTIEYLKKYNKLDEAKGKIEKIRDLIFSDLQGDPTEISFWTVVESKKITKEMKSHLENAHKIMRILISREIIKKFFDFMGEQNDAVTVERSEFWRPYCSSPQFERIYIVLNERQKNELFNCLNPKERIIFRSHIIYNRSTGLSESPALIIAFTTKTIIEFTKLGNATQVYNSDNLLLQSIIRCEQIDRVKDLKYYSQQSVFTDYREGVGTIVHNGDWQWYTKRFLRQNGIQDGND